MALFLDLRGKNLKALIIEGESVGYAKIFEGVTLNNSGEVKKFIDAVSTESGLNTNDIHIILPEEDVVVNRFKLQSMPFADARKIISRKISADTVVENPVFNAVPLGIGKMQQNYITETIKPEIAEKYNHLFSLQNIKLKTLSTAFNANLKAIKRLKGEILQTGAIIDLERDNIGFTVMSDTNVLFHESIQPGYFDVSKDGAGISVERLNKMLTYMIIDAFYKIHRSYSENFPDNPIKVIWVCGLKGGMEGIADALKDATGAEVETLNTMGKDITNGFAFLALHGLSFGVADGTAVNLLPARISKFISPKFLKKAAAVTGVVYLLLLVFTVLFTENRLTGMRKMLDKEVKEVKELERKSKSSNPYIRHIKYLNSLAQNEVAFYEIFKHLSNNMPDGVNIDGFVFKSEKNQRVIELSFVSKYYSEIGSKRLLSRVMEVLNNSVHLSKHEEPVMIVSSAGREKSVNFKVNCLVGKDEKSK